MENSRLQLWTTQWTIAFPQWSMQATMHVMQLCKLISYVHQSEYEGEQGHARVEKKRGWGIFNLLFFYVFFFLGVETKVGGISDPRKGDSAGIRTAANTALPICWALPLSTSPHPHPHSLSPPHPSFQMAMP